MEQPQADGLTCFLYREELRKLGFMVRMTEWSEGFQVCAFWKTDTRKCFVSDWKKTELEATTQCFSKTMDMYKLELKPKEDVE
jgi:hypothetical protein